MKPRYPQPDVPPKQAGDGVPPTRRRGVRIAVGLGAVAIAVLPAIFVMPELMEDLGWRKPARRSRSPMAQTPEKHAARPATKVGDKTKPAPSATAGVMVVAKAATPRPATSTAPPAPILAAAEPAKPQASATPAVAIRQVSTAPQPPIPIAPRAAPVAKPVANPVVAPQAPQIDAALQARLVGRTREIQELLKQRRELLAANDGAKAEQALTLKLIEFDRGQMQKLQTQLDEALLAIADIDARVDEIDAIPPRPAGGSIVVRSSFNGLIDTLVQRRAALRLHVQATQVEMEKTRLKQQANIRLIPTFAPRFTALARQADALRKAWLTHFDWHGKWTADEHGAMVRFWNEQLAADPGNHGLLTARALSYIHLGQTEQAMAELRIADDATNPFAQESLTLRGYLKALAGDERGFTELGQAVVLERRTAIPYLMRAQASAHAGRYNSAEADLKLAVQYEPANADTHRLQALYYAAAQTTGARKHKEALAAAQRAVDQSQRKDWQALLALAAAEADQGQFAKASDLASEAADVTTDELRTRCLKQRDRYTAQQPLRLVWTLAE